MNNDIFKETLKIAQDLHEKMDDLTNLQTRAFNQLPETERAKLKFVENDIAKMKRAFKKGDESVIKEMLSKYADQNNTK